MFRHVCRFVVIGIIVLSSNSCGERRTVYYSTWHEAVKDEATTRGWIPSFLPSSSTNIAERHDLDSNAGAFCFSAPASDLKLLASQMQLVPRSDFDFIGPWIDGPSKCWPRSLARKRFNVLTQNDGFEVYRKERSNDQPAGSHVWYFAINAQKGSGFGWYKGD